MSDRLAILSVYDKQGIIPFAKALTKQGVKILSTGGTAKTLSEAGIKVQSISDYTGHPEVFDGRVKSLHPKIHGGILARRDNSNDKIELEKNQILPIDFVIVNLYPFSQTVAETEAAGDPEHDSLVEMIDIGGPTMIRAAAKNCRFVVPVCDPADYDVVISELEKSGEVSLQTRQRLAAKVFATMSAYDGAVARYFSLGERLLDDQKRKKQMAPVEAIVLEKLETLRYGENPHQQSGLYRQVTAGAARPPAKWELLQGKELSYNNIVDMQAALDLALELYPHRGSEQIAVVIKHTNPCGVAARSTTLAAFETARACDPLSAFGGIISLSGLVDEVVANSVLEQFVEVVIVEELTDEAVRVFQKKKNVRLIRCDFAASIEAQGSPETLIKKCADFYLLQSADSQLAEISPSSIVTGSADTALLKELNFAWRVCKHVKSNTIVISKNLQAIGVGAGQMSRVDAAKIAFQRAKDHGHDVDGAVAASDAFLPFSDTLEVLAEQGVKALVQPGGSVKDEDVIKRAAELGVVMAFTGERHFRH